VSAEPLKLSSADVVVVRALSGAEELRKRFAFRVMGYGCRDAVA
jgi:hypothetical protein